MRWSVLAAVGTGSDWTARDLAQEMGRDVLGCYELTKKDLKRYLEISAWLKAAEVQQGVAYESPFDGDEAHATHVGPASPQKNSKKGKEEESCPVCFEKFSRENWVLKDGPSNSDFETECCHWLCVDCWTNIYEHGNHQCPICREDVSEWLTQHYGSDESESE